jgi:hypothetical protein
MPKVDKAVNRTWGYQRSEELNERSATAGRFAVLSSVLILFTLLVTTSAFPQDEATVTARWDQGASKSRTSVSMSVCVEPPLRRTSPIHDQLFDAIRDLKADFLHFQPWRPYPRIAVAELEPPHDGKTYWDFSLLDPILIDFMKAAAGRPVVMNISTIPQWMFKTDKPVAYPSDPDEITWNYEQGTELRDPTMKEVAEYWARVVSWYTKGGFNDEYGKWHESGHHFKFAYWEVLNEVEYEHTMTPEFYTALYDAIVTEVRKVAPEMKFVGMALGPSGPLTQPKWFEYFLDPKNHRPGIPIDAFSYHYYCQPCPEPDAGPETLAFTLFPQAIGFVNVVRYIEAIRQRLAPHAMTMIDEVGTIFPDSQTPESADRIPNVYWNASAAMFAFLYPQLTRLGIDVVHESELIDYPGQYPGTTLVHWKTGRPNARYWVLKLIRENFAPGDKLVGTRVNVAAAKFRDSSTTREFVSGQAFVTNEGKRRILVVNKRDQSFEIVIPDGAGAQVEYVDQKTASDPPAKTTLKGDRFTLGGFGVAVVTLAK